MAWKFAEAGLTVTLDEHPVLLSYPVSRSLTLVDSLGREEYHAPLEEAVLAQDPTSDTPERSLSFNGYAPSGTVTAPLVYANFGRPDDFAALAAAGVDVTGKIALIRYGMCFRGNKAANAEAAGALAAILFSDPEQDGFARGKVA